MKNNLLARAIFMSFILLVPTFVDAEEKPVTILPHLESVKEAEVKDTGVITVGGKVLHQKFGIGVVKSIHLGDDTTKVNIIFETLGSKWLIAEYANLKVVND